MQQSYDVVIIGGGVVGSAIARELSRYKLRIAVLEKESDVCTQTSRRNTGSSTPGSSIRPAPSRPSAPWRQPGVRPSSPRAGCPL